MVDTVKAEPYDWPYDGVIVPSRTAMLVIDMQQDFCGRGAMSIVWATTSP